MAQDNEELVDIGIKVGVVVAAYFLIVKPVMAQLGLGTSAPPNIAKQLAVSPGQNPFNPDFGPYINAYYPGSAVSLLCQNGGAAVKAGSNPLNVLAEQIYNAFGYIAHDDNAVISAFNAIQDQVSVAYIADYLDCVYQRDLLTLLQKGAWWVGSLTSGLSDTELSQIVTNVNALPQFVASAQVATGSGSPASSAADGWDDGSDSWDDGSDGWNDSLLTPGITE
jgi:hypothetical protein